MEGVDGDQHHSSRPPGLRSGTYPAIPFQDTIDPVGYAQPAYPPRSSDAPPFSYHTNGPRLPYREYLQSQDPQQMHISRTAQHHCLPYVPNFHTSVPTTQDGSKASDTTQRPKWDALPTYQSTVYEAHGPPPWPASQQEFPLHHQQVDELQPSSARCSKAFRNEPVSQTTAIMVGTHLLSKQRQLLTIQQHQPLDRFSPISHHTSVASPSSSSTPYEMLTEDHDTNSFGEQSYTTGTSISGGELRYEVGGKHRQDSTTDAYVSDLRLPETPQTQHSNQSSTSHDLMSEQDFPLQPPYNVSQDTSRLEAIGRHFDGQDGNLMGWWGSQESGYQMSDSRNNETPGKPQHQLGSYLNSTDGFDSRVLYPGFGEQMGLFSTYVDNTVAGGNDLQSVTTAVQDQMSLQADRHNLSDDSPGHLNPSASSQPRPNLVSPSDFRFAPHYDQLYGARDPVATSTSLVPENVATDRFCPPPSATSRRGHNEHHLVETAHASCSSDSVSPCPACKADPNCKDPPAFRGNYQKANLIRHIREVHGPKKDERHFCRLFNKHGVRCGSGLKKRDRRKHVENCHEEMARLLPRKDATTRPQNPEVDRMLNEWFERVNAQVNDPLSGPSCDTV